MPTHGGVQVPKGWIVVAPGDLKSCPGSNDEASRSGEWEYDLRHPVAARSIVLVFGKLSLFVDDRQPAALSSAAEFLIPAEDVAGIRSDHPSHFIRMWPFYVLEPVDFLLHRCSIHAVPGIQY
jgi:hypothetical protein